MDREFKPGQWRLKADAPRGVFAALCSKRTKKSESFLHLIGHFSRMLDKTIGSALLNLRRQIVRGGLDGLPHVEALLVVRGINPSCHRIAPPRAPNMFPRRELRRLITEGLRDGPMRGRDVAAYVSGREPSATYAQAIRRVYQALAHMQTAGMVVRDGKVWKIIPT